MEKLCNNMAAEINNVVTAFYELSNQHYAKYWTLEDSALEYWNRIIKCINCEEYAINLIKEYYNKNQKTYITILENIIVFCTEVCKTRQYKVGINQYGVNQYNYIDCAKETKIVLMEKYDKYVSILNKLEPQYVPPAINRKFKKAKWF